MFDLEFDLDTEKMNCVHDKLIWAHDHNITIHTYNFTLIATFPNR